MGRTSKFSFPLPGRKTRPQQPNEDSTLAEEPKPRLSKAQRLLGQTDIPISHTPQYYNNQNALRKQPSSITLTVYEPTIVDPNGSNIDLRHTPSLHNSPAVPQLPEHLRNVGDKDRIYPPPRSLSLNQNGSSPMADARKEKAHRTMSVGPPPPDVRQFKSAGALNIQYEQLEMSAPINEQAEMPERTASKKSQSNASHSLFPVVEDPPTPTALPRMPSMADRRMLEKKRPTRLDLGKLFPRPSNPTMTTVTSPLSSPTYAPFNPVRFPSDPRGSTDLPSQTPSIKSARSSRKVVKKHASPPESIMEEERRPKTAGATVGANKKHIDKAAATKHWFDGLLEAEDDFDVSYKTSVVPKSFNAKKKRTIAQDLSIRLVDRSSPFQQNQNQNRNSVASSLDARSHRSTWQPYQNVQSLRPGLPSDTTSRRSSLAPSGYSLRRPETSSRLARPARSPLLAEHPRAQSPFKRLDEEGTDSDVPHVRDSIVLSDIDDVVTIGEAQAFSVRPQRHLEIVETVEVKRMARPVQRQMPIYRHSSLSPAPPLLRGSKSASSLSVYSKSPALSQSSKFAYDTNSPSLRPDSFTASDFSSRPDSVICRIPSMQSSVTNGTELKQKLMAVTEEEEALLALMRERRAAMNTESYADGFKAGLMSIPQSPVSPLSTGDQLSITSGEVTHSHSSTLSSIDSQVRHFPASQLSQVDRTIVMQRKLPGGSHTKLSSTSTFHSAVSSAPGYAESAYQFAGSASTEPMHIRVGGFPPSSVSADSGLSMSPSDKSNTSGIPSPVTPHAVPAAREMRVQVAGHCSELGDDTVFETPKSQTLPNGFNSLDNTPKATPSQQDTESYNNYELASSQSDQEDCSHDHHIHHSGCCTNSNIRCSVADDVLAAWNSLGGWQNLSTYSSVH